jgi:hypothetical protein
MTPTQNGDCVGLPYKDLSRLFSKERNRQRRQADNNSSAIVEEYAVTRIFHFLLFNQSDSPEVNPRWPRPAGVMDELSTHP